ncbi:uncharacterized protein LOC125377394 [Haliotis rufescens]|uniref:uncharacterized protein LOC125377394 n=1 Tax=Haliotis rufescens TaxID=6454 RepID=UPI00201FA81D|nr:uncharacterized protein LOC125377394 [Haliotis rufescens]
MYTQRQIETRVCITDYGTTRGVTNVQIMEANMELGTKGKSDIAGVSEESTWRLQPRCRGSELYFMTHELALPIPPRPTATNSGNHNLLELEQITSKHPDGDFEDTSPMKQTLSWWQIPSNGGCRQRSSDMTSENEDAFTQFNLTTC